LILIYSSKGSTALYVAAQNGHSDVVKALVKAYANPDIEYRTDSKARRPVDIAKESGYKEIERFLKTSLPYAGEHEPTEIE
jgi:ankyrin repeat protein